MPSFQNDIFRKIKISLISLGTALLAFTFGASISKAQNKEVCQASTLTSEKSSEFLKSLKKDQFFQFAQKQSKLIECKNDDMGLNLVFQNGDKITYYVSDIAPGSEFRLSKPLEEKKAFELAKKSMNKFKGRACRISLNKPSEVQDDKAQGQTTKIFWCGENVATSLVLNSSKNVVKIRTWMHH